MKFTVFLLLLFLCPALFAQNRVDVRIVTDQAEAVLAILNKKHAGAEITGADWQKVFSSEGYIRLQKRERSMSRSFEDADFKTFVLSSDLVAKRQALADTLARWKEIDPSRPAGLALAYLPQNALIRAKIYPVIKPRENSFVFDIPADPAIFLYLDPAVSREKFENTLAHELHHIGFGTGCPAPGVAAKIKTYPADIQKVLKWVGAFGEGFAMLAAAGGPDVHPHSVGSTEDRARWDRDVADFNNNLKTVEKFFLDLADGKLSETQENETARSFYGVQGPWYTVGWRMAVVIEKTYGRKKLIESMCDQRMLFATFNKAVKKYNRRNKADLASWSEKLTGKFGD